MREMKDHVDQVRKSRKESRDWRGTVTQDNSMVFNHANTCLPLLHS
jgi:hypothetical protein